ncbi:MAG: mechanosensitive ion channel [Proteobacteria bacterium]|nr:mechanosensitive ion channel [Pseudomonadota bacterium]
MEEQLTRLTDYVVANYQEWLIVPVIVLAGYLVIRTTDKYVARFFDRVEYDRTLEILFQKTIKVFLWSVVLILALANIGFDVSGFIAGLGVMGFIVGFAVKDVLSNLAAGMFLLVKRPFKVGESVNVAGVQGNVEEMTLSSCLVITEEGHHVTIPNAKIWGNAIRNLSRGASKQRGS